MQGVAFLLLFPDRHQEGRSGFQEVYLSHCPLSGLCLLSVCSVAIQRRTVAWTDEPLLSALPTPSHFLHSLHPRRELWEEDSATRHLVLGVGNATI